MDSKDEKTEQNDKAIQKKILTVLCRYFEVTLDDFAEIFQKLSYADDQDCIERCVALEKHVEQNKLKDCA